MDAKKTQEHWENNHAAMVAADEGAKEKGERIGRYLAFPYADGYSFYRIVSETSRTVQLEVVTDIGDDYVHPLIGEANKMARKQVVSLLEERDAEEAFVARMKSKQKEGKSHDRLF